MSILLSGDFHANAAGEIHCITRKTLIGRFGKEKFDAIKYHVILGDGGFLWPGNAGKDLYNNKILGRRPFPVLCVPGNHEPFYGRSDLPLVDIGIGETVYRICEKPFIAYLRRGTVYTIEGLKFLVLGGALSIDKAYRKPNISWWEQEYWTEQEKEALLQLLDRDTTFDYVLSHTGPGRINKTLFENGWPNFKKFRDEVAILNDFVDSKIKCREWWCGHWHRDVYFFDDEMNRGYQYLYAVPKILKNEE